MKHISNLFISSPFLIAAYLLTIGLHHPFDVGSIYYITLKHQIYESSLLDYWPFSYSMAVFFGALYSGFYNLSKLFPAYWFLIFSLTTKFPYLLATIIAIRSIKRTSESLYGVFRSWELAIIIPAALFISFVHGMFDIIAVALVCRATESLILRDANRSLFFLSIAVLIKWYALIYLPFFLLFLYNNKTILATIITIWRGLSFFTITLVVEFTARFKLNQTGQHIINHLSSEVQPTWQSIWSILDISEDLKFTYLSFLYGGWHWTIWYIGVYSCALYVSWRELKSMREKPDEFSTRYLFHVCFNVTLYLILLTPSSMPQFTLWLIPFYVFVPLQSKLLTFYAQLLGVLWLGHIETYNSYVYDVTRISNTNSPRLFIPSSPSQIVITLVRSLFFISLLTGVLRSNFRRLGEATLMLTENISIEFTSSTGIVRTLKLNPEIRVVTSVFIQKLLDFDLSLKYSSRVIAHLNPRYLTSLMTLIISINIPLVLYIVVYPMLTLAYSSTSIVWAESPKERFPLLPSQARFEVSSAQLMNCETQLSIIDDGVTCEVLIEDAALANGWPVRFMWLASDGVDRVKIADLIDRTHDSTAFFDSDRDAFMIHLRSCSTSKLLSGGPDIACKVVVGVDTPENARINW